MKEFVHKIIKKLDSITCTYYTSSKKQKLFATATARTVSLIVGYNDENSDDDDYDDDFSSITSQSSSSISSSNNNSGGCCCVGRSWGPDRLGISVAGIVWLQEPIYPSKIVYLLIIVVVGVVSRIRTHHHILARMITE